MENPKTSNDHLISLDNNHNHPTNNSYSPNEDSSESSHDSLETASSVDSWISWFCSLPGHSYFLYIPEDYIEDDFNLTGLSSIVPYFNEAMDMILDLEPESPAHSKSMANYIESSAELLYGLIHQRYIISRAGLAAMAERCEAKEFGICPRVGCGNSAVVPCGRSSHPGEETVKMYCPRCDDLYHPKEAKYQNVDGAFFSNTFPHLLFLTFPELVPPLKSGDLKEGDLHADLESYGVYTPKIFGFKVSILSPVGPKMRWLRCRET